MPARPFPAQTVRDLIGIARLLYRTWASASARDGRLPELVAIGKDLQQSLKMARDSKPGTRAHREAWELAEVATSRLGGVLDAYVAVKPLIASALDRVDRNAGEEQGRESAAALGSLKGKIETGLPPSLGVPLRS